MSTLNSLLEKVENAKALDFGDIFNKSIELFKKVWLQAFVAKILAIIMIVPFYFLMYLPMVAVGIFASENFENGEAPSALFVVFMALMGLLLFVVAITASNGMNAALYRICKERDFGEMKSDDYFFFFKKKYIRKTITLGLVMSGIVIVSLLLFVLPVFYVIIPISYMSVIYAFNPDLSVSDIVKSGFALGNKKWFLSFLLAVVAWLVSTIIGFLLCLVGVYFTQQFIVLPFYEVYKETIGFKEQNPIDEIGKPIE